MIQRFIRHRSYPWLSFVLLAIVVAGCEPSAETNDPTAALEPSAADLGTEKSTVEAAKIVPMKPSPESSSESETSPSLGIGDPAPPLRLASWRLGEPFDGFEEGQVYVVEFWATWCGPCLAGMPHMSETQEAYGDKVKIVGITRETQDVVDRFLAKEQSDGMTWEEVIKYRLALDEGGATNTAYMRAANQNGIPTAFIVGKDGIVEWIGHPARMDQPLEEIVNNAWDRDAAIADFKAQKILSENMRKLSTLQRGQKWDEALALLDELEQQLGENPSLLNTRVRILRSAGRNDELAATRSRLVDLAWENSMLLNQVAWETAIAKDRTEDDLSLALKAAERAAELSKHEDGMILDTLARVHYERGDLEEAIQWQEKAVEHAGDTRGIQQTLDKYLSEKESQ